MKKTYLLFILLQLSINCIAQEIDSDLLYIKNRMDSIQEFSADLELNLDVSFINMPTKHASVLFKKDEELDFSSEDFVMLPKRGLDFSLSELFKYPFITVDRSKKNINGTLTKVLNIIPTDDKADFALATVYLDIEHKRIHIAEINTKKLGSYTITMTYENKEAILPDNVTVTFAMEKLKIPLNFMGRDTDIDRKKMRNLDTKEGKIMMKISNYKITY
ncbi:hypothetical protein SAMN05216480_105174 [Pustulibacterium marinum]|uniref:Outer membrane lipoprotein-sorting protein n=1 Tax=Pustulibacterium marinum TaxID=1224947 RepID=A0A1I7GQF5_9FLAO|nr:hypothetical protein [Pustulibacterium marinum]SFU50678.1 hypothetical protein SAMN05216480_105174 [Pustulibacterium marinum]